MKRLILILVVIYLLPSGSHAQQKYWIYFKDKTPSILQSTATDVYDLPVSQAYIDSLKVLNIKKISTSRWLNAVTSVLSKEQCLKLQKINFIKSIEPVNSHLRVLSNQIFDGNNLVLEQIHADTLMALGYTGKNVKVGIIDGGFLDADKEESLNIIIGQNQIGGYKNFIDKDMSDPFTGERRYNDNHGTKVWKLIGGYLSKQDKHFGLATEATYYLARTDQGDKEYRGEEDNWIAALEWMYSQGIRLVNSSLGYSTGFDNPDENYNPSDVDGHSSAITKAANIATTEKEMLLVMSAGNDGNKKFKVISIPADAPGVITVGASGYKIWKRQYYSSIGPEGLDSLKPDLVCYSMTGTSFSAPIITGLMACLIQAYPETSPSQMIDILKKSCHISSFPNNYIGSGVPDTRKILKLLNDSHPVKKSKIIHATEEQVELHFLSDNVVAFHKSGEYNVMSQKNVKVQDDLAKISRPKDIKRTTVASPEMVYEIIWE